MLRGFHLQARRGVVALMCFVIGVAAWVLLTGEAKRWQLSVASEAALRRPTGYPQLFSVEPLPMMDGGMCQWVPASTPTRLMAALRQERLSARVATASPADTRAAVAVNRAPVRVIRDPYPTYSAVAVDPIRDEIVLQDENLFQILVYDRLTNTPPTAAMSEPKRVIGGHDTKVEFNCGLYIDPESGDIYSINNDTVDTMVVFSRNARGNVHPDRELHTPHRTYGIAVDEKAQELFLTVQHPPAVAVYRKMAQDDEEPLRILGGPNTQLEDTHGIALDTKNGWMFVGNHGAVAYDQFGEGSSGNPQERRRNLIPGTGRFEPPSITVHPIKASGDEPPLRIIEGSKTQLNWPAQMYVDEEHGELFVANDVGDSILVFRVTDNGNVAPLRVLQGPKTGLKNPTGVSVDTKNQELVVANMGNHTATVYPRTAQGDTAPLRTIRAGPLGKRALAIGNPGAVGYDSKREEILVPN
ncbi:MAG: hypothetical protein O7A06_02145 [Acidobacteria bacterium]|nr:hypothetical protein [Acidobacteriota bacterium]MCZ6752219.1 hypothetical protein [Acidobacteriota bacterium]